MNNEQAIREQRVDPHLGTVVNVVRSRQDRPNLPTAGCPFCVGGLEAPEDDDVMSFPNRGPALGEGRCEVVLYTPDHDATFAHPHGQVYAYDHVPSRPRRRLEAGWRPDPDPGERLILEHQGWRVWTHFAPIHPISISIAHEDQFLDLPSADRSHRSALADTMIDLLARLDRLYDRPLPYMMWLNQAPVGWSGEVSPWFNIELVSPWRAAGVLRFIAAAELACDEYFNPVAPEDVASRLREVSA